jgi:hypothetical protein
MNPRLSSVRRPADPNGNDGASSSAKGQVNEPTPASFSAENDTEEAPESPRGKRLTPRSRSDRPDRRCVCGERIVSGRLGRPRMYCARCRPPRHQHGIPPAPRRKPVLVQRNTETIRLHASLVVLSGDERPDDLVTTAVEECVYIDAAGRVTRVEVQQTVRATRPGVCTYLFIHYGGDRRTGPRVRVKGTRGCTADRVSSLVGESRWASPLTIAGPPLQENEERTIGFTVTHENRGCSEFPNRHLRTVLTDTVKSLTIRLEFATPGARVERCRWADLHGEPTERTCVLLRGEQITLSWPPLPVKPGVYGARWDVSGGQPN